MKPRALIALLFVPGLRAQPPDVRPIFEKSCYACHGSKLQSANLRLDRKPEKVIVPGDAANSSLYQRITGAGDQPRMPMGGKPLDPQQIAIIKSWIDRGAEWPETTTQAAPATHWAWRPPVRAAFPQVSNTTWPRNAVDYFVLERLDSENFSHRPKPTA